jgi:uncharacterized caspase-like protein
MRNLFEKAYGNKTKAHINQDATYLAKSDAVEKMSAAAEGKDVYVFYSGHGFPKNGSPAIVPYDTPGSVKTEYLVSLAWIVNKFKEGGARKVVVFADACYSGYNKEGKMLVAGARPVVFLIKKFSVGDVFASATSKEGKSYSDKRLKHGIFTYYLAKGLLEGDKNHDGVIEAEELKEYMEKAKRHAMKLGYSDQEPVFEAMTKVVVSK